MLFLSIFSSLFFSRSLPSRRFPLSERMEQATKFERNSFSLAFGRDESPVAFSYPVHYVRSLYFQCI